MHKDHMPIDYELPAYFFYHDKLEEYEIEQFHRYREEFRNGVKLPNIDEEYLTKPLPHSSKYKLRKHVDNELLRFTSVYFDLRISKKRKNELLKLRVSNEPLFREKLDQEAKTIYNRLIDEQVEDDITKLFQHIVKTQDIFNLRGQLGLEEEPLTLRIYYFLTTSLRFWEIHQEEEENQEQNPDGINIKYYPNEHFWHIELIKKGARPETALFYDEDKLIDHIKKTLHQLKTKNN